MLGWLLSESAAVCLRLRCFVLGEAFDTFPDRNAPALSLSTPILAPRSRHAAAAQRTQFHPHH